MILTLANATIESINLVINTVRLSYLIIETTIYIPYSLYCYMTKQENLKKNKPSEDEIIEISKADFKKILDKIDKMDTEFELMYKHIMETKL
jgi:hypothetical protein